MDSVPESQSVSRSVCLFMQQAAQEVLYEGPVSPDLKGGCPDGSLEMLQGLCVSCSSSQPRVPMKLENAEIVAVILYWLSRPWFALLVQLSYQGPVPLPLRLDLLS